MGSMIITLLTDFGTRDPYVGVMKGVLCSLAPRARLVDLTHEIPPGRIDTAAFLLSNAFGYFPKGTIHLCVVDPGVGSRRKALVLESGGQYFVGPDNGLFPAALAGHRIERVFELTLSRVLRSKRSDTFHGRDVFAPAAATLARGVPPNRLGHPRSSLEPGALPTPLRTASRWIGEILWVDRFGNLVTNLPAHLLKKGAVIKAGKRTIRKIGTHYAQVTKGGLMALPGSFGTVEVSVNGGSASKRLGARIGTPVELR